MTRLLTWLHLSDIHFGDGTRRHVLDKRLVLSTLLDDVRHVISEFQLQPDLILVTGDVAYSGATRSATEYADAARWLNDLLDVVKRTPTELFLVPGNHDADLSRDDESELRRLLDSIRAGTDALDDLGEPDWRRLNGRFQRYREFAAAYGPATATVDHGGHWMRRFELEALQDLPLLLVGMNTATTTKIARNERALFVGKEVVVAVDNADARNALVLLLTHHPLNADWIGGSSSDLAALLKHVDIHLCGHVHSAETESRRSGAGGGLTTIVSGAAHAPDGEEVGHGYSFGALELDSEGLLCRVWPQIYFPAKQDFDRHGDILVKDRVSAEHRLGDKPRRLLERVRSRNSENPLGGARATQNASLLDGVSDRLKPFAEATVGEALATLKRVAMLQQTPELSAGAYYEFLLPLIAETADGESIWAISTMMNVEWTEDQFEKDFLRANLDAADRGVLVERIFVVPEAEVSGLAKNPAVVAQVEHERVGTLLVTRERLQQLDQALLHRIGPGLIGFGTEIVLIDRHGEDGEARGVGYALREEVSRWSQTYRELRRFASPLDFGEPAS